MSLRAAFLSVSVGCAAPGHRRQVGDSGGSTTDGAPPYELVADALPAALLGVWRGADGVTWLVGADDGSGPLVLRYDGAWSRVETGTRGALWWVWGEPGAVWMSGAGGRVLRHDPATGDTAEVSVTTPDRTVFGLWGTTSADLWAVAADPSGARPGQVLRHDGVAWSVAWEVPDGRQPFKVWGTGPTDVHVVGTEALVAHFDGVGWTTRPAPVDAGVTLFTVHGSGTDHAVAVGGVGGAAVARWDGTAWSDDSPPAADFAPALTGVNVHPTHGTVAAGNNGAIWRRGDDGWEADRRAPPILWNYHATVVDDAGGIWAVGGDLYALDVGVVLYGGDEPVPKL